MQLDIAFEAWGWESTEEKVLKLKVVGLVSLGSANFCFDGWGFLADSAERMRRSTVSWA